MSFLYTCPFFLTCFSDVQLYIFTTACMFTLIFIYYIKVFNLCSIQGNIFARNAYFKDLFLELMLNSKKVGIIFMRTIE